MDRGTLEGDLLGCALEGIGSKNSFPRQRLLLLKRRTDDASCEEMGENAHIKGLREEGADLPRGKTFSYGDWNNIDGLVGPVSI